MERGEGINRIECVVVLCGVPGSGKTTFASTLIQEYDQWRKHSEKESSSMTALSEVVSFDEFITEEEQWDETTFKSSRKAALQQIHSLLHAQSQTMHSIEESILPSVPVGRILVVDDLMYLGSMRHEVYKVARDTRVPVPQVVIWVNTDVDIAVSRNATRAALGQPSVHEDTIRRIHELFEPPHSHAIADRLHYIIDTHTDERSTRDWIRFIFSNGWLEQVRSHAGYLLQQQQQQQQQSNMNVTSIDTSIIPFEMNKNIVSIADNLIRRLVSIVLQMLPKEIKKIAGSYLANIKSNTLKFIKNHAAIQYENMRNKANRSATGNSTNTEDICPLPWELDEFISQTSIYLLEKAANILDIHNDVINETIMNTVKAAAAVLAAAE